MRQNSTSFTSVLTMSLLSISKLHWKTVINFFMACTSKVMAEELPPIKQIQEGKKEEKKSLISLSVGITSSIGPKHHSLVFSNAVIFPTVVF